ncbi:MAG TPA: Uma2 family endonuclease [Blastocatellia bacterium]|nr:Uma2 family endonuclease [Blastocatellia bacterium]
MAIVTEVDLDTEKEYEIVDGHPEKKIMGGARHGGVGVRLIIELGTYIKINKLGRLYGPDTTFQIGLNERIPDIAFVSAERIPPEGEPEGKWRIPPDLAVEIISPTDLWNKVNPKVREYFAAGVRQVWLISLEEREVRILNSPTAVTVLTEDEELTSALLPGFSCRIREIFQHPTRNQPSS